MKLFATVLSQPLAGDINNNISQAVFPYNATIVCFPADKQSNNKSKVLNFKPVSVLNMPSKIFESAVKNLDQN